MYLATVKKRKEESPFLTDDYPIGCSNKEIEAIEAFIGGRLPEAYREFLLWMGHSCGQFLRGSDCFYESLKDLQYYHHNFLERRFI